MTNLLYSRRLPSPPVFRRRHEFILNNNSSHTSVPQDDVSSRSLAAQLINESKSKVLYCPLCIQTFGYSFGLECHLLSVHEKELQEMKRIRIDNIKTQCCPTCGAHFLRPGVLTRHLVYHHPDYVIDILLGNDHDANADCVQCRFCGQHFLRKHKRLLMLHVEQKHVLQLEGEIRNTESLEECDNKSLELTLMLSSPTVLNAVENRRKKRIKSQSIKEEDQSFHLDRRMSSRRSLRFDLPVEHHYDVIDDSVSKRDRSSGEESILDQSIKKRKDTEGQVRQVSYFKHSKSNGSNTPLRTKSKDRNGATYRHVPQPEPPNRNTESEDEVELKRNSGRWTLQRRKSKDKDVEMHEQSRLFKCNLCHVAFLENAFLLTHLKNKHRSTISKLALKPQYSCGACPAKFFKNSFLVKHAQSHQFHLVDNFAFGEFAKDR